MTPDVTPLRYHIRRPSHAGLSDELALTVDAMVRHRWTLVLLAPHSKCPPTGRPWQLTEDAGVVASHVGHGGNVGLVCGLRSGVAVLDPDQVGWVDMVETLGQPADAWVQTGGGKLHYYVSWQPGLPAKLVWAGDTIGEIQRGPGLQQVVVPPSIHPRSGRPYRWLTSPAERSLEPLPATWRRYFALQTSFTRVTGTPGYLNASAFKDRLTRALQQPGARFRRHSGCVKFQCSACAPEGHDRHRDNGIFFVNSGRWGSTWPARWSRTTPAGWRPRSCGGSCGGWLDAAHPDAALFAEWGHPEASIPGGFHVDFFLHFTGRAFRSLWDNGQVARPEWPPLTPYFDPSGGGSLGAFLDEWSSAASVVGDAGYAALPSSNHDFPRLAAGPRTGEQLKPAFTFLLTWPTLPAIYYGDEIGMRYVPGLPNIEGSARTPTYNRAGSRTPMQWSADDPSGAVYLPVDPDPARPTVAAQRADPGSILHLVRDLIALRRAHPDLGTRGDTEVLHAGYPFVYRRGGFTVAVNPRATAASVPLAAGPGSLLLGSAGHTAGTLDVPPFGYAIFERLRQSVSRVRA